MNKSFLWSLLGHVVIILLMVLDLSFGFKKHEPTPPAIMIVDLTKVKISNKTNLPQKAVVQKKKAEPKPQKKVEEKKSTPKSTPKPVEKSESKPTVKPKEVPIKESVPVKTNEVEKKDKNPEPIQKQEKKPNYDLQNLLASVEKVRKAPTIKEVEKENVPQENEGIKGGAEGRIDQILTISERDFLVSELQKCWNVNAGVERADEIVVEIKALINKNGTVQDVKIMNTMPISSFKSVAESAERAVRICDRKGDESPFRILATKYADHYADWKEISLYFSPLQGIQSN